MERRGDYGYDAPYGLVIFAALGATARHAGTLSELGAIGIARRRLGWRFWYGNPFAGTSLVTASKLEGA